MTIEPERVWAKESLNEKPHRLVSKFINDLVYEI